MNELEARLNELENLIHNFNSFKTLFDNAKVQGQYAEAVETWYEEMNTSNQRMLEIVAEFSELLNSSTLSEPQKIQAETKFADLLQVFQGESIQSIEDAKEAYVNADTSKINYPQEDAFLNFIEEEKSKKLSSSPVSIFYQNRGNYKGAIEEEESKIKQSIELKDYLSAGCGNRRIGEIYSRIRNENLAREAFGEALRIFDAHDQTPSKAASLKRERGLLYESWGLLEAQFSNYKEAVNRFDQAIEIFRQLNDEYKLAWLCLHKGSSLESQNKAQEAEKCFKEAEEFFKRFGQQLNSDLAETYNRLGSLATEDNEKENYYKRSRTADPTNGCPVGNLGSIELRRGNYAEAEGLFRTALDHYESNDYRNKFITSKELVEVLNLQGKDLISGEKNDYEVAISKIEEAIHIIRDLKSISSEWDRNDPLLQGFDAQEEEVLKNWEEAWRRKYSAKYWAEKENFAQRKDYERAISTFERMLALMHKVEDQMGMAKALLGLGDVYLAIGRYGNPDNPTNCRESKRKLRKPDNASTAYERAYRLFKKTSSRKETSQEVENEKKKGEADCLLGKSKIYHALGNIGKSRELVGIEETRKLIDNQSITR